MPDSLGDRMKAYEDAYRFYLPKKLPVIIRIDGRAFHTFTRGFLKPFDEVLQNTMSKTALALCEAVSGVKLAYTQSDEISLLVTNDDEIETQPWFNNNLQKLVSLTASIATSSFSHNLIQNTIQWDYKQEDVDIEQYRVYMRSFNKANFDSRAFILPPDEVVNYFIWRQQDATRNSIQMVAQSLYSHKELLNKNCDQLQDMIHDKGINWNDYPVKYKRGTCCIKTPVEIHPDVFRNKWVVDDNIPIFTENREYVENTFLIKKDN